MNCALNCIVMVLGTGDTLREILKDRLFSHILCDAKNINEKESLFLEANLFSFLSKIIIWFLCHKEKFIIVQMIAIRGL